MSDSVWAGFDYAGRQKEAAGECQRADLHQICSSRIRTAGDRVTQAVISGEFDTSRHSTRATSIQNGLAITIFDRSSCVEQPLGSQVSAKPPPTGRRAC